MKLFQHSFYTKHVHFVFVSDEFNKTIFQTGIFLLIQHIITIYINILVLFLFKLFQYSNRLIKIATIEETLYS